MSITRYDATIRPGYGGETFPGMEEDETGEYVKYSDHEKALSHAEARAAKLESILRDAEPWLGPTHPYWDAKEPGTLEKLHANICAVLKEPTNE